MIFAIGQTFTQIRRFSQSDFDRFATLSGDRNPIHVNPDFSTRSKFGATVAHGMLLYSVVSGMIHQFLPSDFTQQWQTLMFPNPTYTDTDVSIELMVTHIKADIIRLKTITRNPNGGIGLQGETELRRTLSPHPPNIAESQPPATLKGLAIGDMAHTVRTFTPANLREFASLAGLDSTPDFVPGPLIGGLFSYLLGMELPGYGTNYLKQSLYFTRPISAGEKLTAAVEISRIRPEKELLNLYTTCTANSGDIVCAGEALVLVSDVPERERQTNHE